MRTILTLSFAAYSFIFVQVVICFALLSCIYFELGNANYVTSLLKARQYAKLSMAQIYRSVCRAYVSASII